MAALVVWQDPVFVARERQSLVSAVALWPWYLFCFDFADSL